MSSQNSYKTGDDDDDDSDYEWDKDSDDINSLDSEELHETRPNRWTGVPSTWRTYTKRDRNTYHALEGVRRQDLAVHLYNAFALKRKFPGGVGGDELPDEGDEDEDELDENGDPLTTKWTPGGLWTAWPMRADEVPDDEFLAHTLDEDELLTARRPVVDFPSRNLEEELSATMLRYAKEKFRRRNFAFAESVEAVADEEIAASDEEDDDEEQEEEDQEGQEEEGQGEGEEEDQEEGEVEEGREAENNGDNDPNNNDNDDDDEERGRRPNKKAKLQDDIPGEPRAPSPTYAPVLLADDELSYELLRPATRRIISKLDDTLTILHNSRMAGLITLSRSVAGSVAGSEAGDGLENERVEPPKPFGRPRVQEPRNRPSAKPQNRGRPRKIHVPREGETEKEMLIRVAREQKTRMPDFYFEEGLDHVSRRMRSRSASRSASRSVSRSESRGSPGSFGRSSSIMSRHSESRSRSKSRLGSVSSSSSSQMSSAVRLARWGLRDWRDVMSAAAMAGFSPTVIARATQRCSTLFGQEMTMHTLLEKPANAAMDAATLTTKYNPGSPLPPSSSDEDDGDIEEDLEKRRIVSRQPSIRQPSPGDIGKHSFECPFPGCPRATDRFTRKQNLERHIKLCHASPENAGGRAGSTPSIRRRSSTPGSRRSVTPGGEIFCPYPTCSRAVKPFARKANFARHLKDRHKGIMPPQPLVLDDDDQDSVDEIDGAVHIDGFLQPIKVRPGWRAIDKSQRFRSRKSKRRGSGSESDPEERRQEEISDSEE
ncbi:hypothetical protein B0H63DRAFT_29732 [Podospora didyma]|uniref:C2H2-type domain-containing protein n=1 Tax=Podospora didyma TaxID=330526 RepID=A0AAE0P5P8_9PEZI|nr:hypothetical protein B0H63DRAFT_29732 [Podospora didyma]